MNVASILIAVVFRNPDFIKTKVDRNLVKTYFLKWLFFNQDFKDFFNCTKPQQSIVHCSS